MQQEREALHLALVQVYGRAGAVNMWPKVMNIDMPMAPRGDGCGGK